MASTSSPGVGLGGPSDEQCRAEVLAVLSSETFRRSPKLSRLLKYLCDKRLDGQASEITEYGIALDVLGRNAEFDPQQDAVVRVDTHHLRKRLKEYYAGPGADHPIQIVIANGQYAPQFAGRVEAPLPDEQVVPGTPEPKRLVDKSGLGKGKWFAALGLPALVVPVADWASRVGKPHERRARLGAGGIRRNPDRRWRQNGALHRHRRPGVATRPVCHRWHDFPPAYHRDSADTRSGFVSKRAGRAVCLRHPAQSRHI